MDAVIFIIRHAEKPEDKGNPHLSTAGWDRAWKLASKPERIGPPTHVFAAAASLESNRPVETISPLASALGLAIDATISDRDIDELCHKLLALAAGSIALVCWHHEHIPKLASKLGASNVPEKYPDVYDQVWVVSPSPGGEVNLDIRTLKFKQK